MSEYSQMIILYLRYFMFECYSKSHQHQLSFFTKFACDQFVLLLHHNPVATAFIA